MRWYEIVTLLLGSTVLVELIKIIADRIKRKDTVTDRRTDAAAQIEELRAETSEQLSQVDKRIDGLENKVDHVSERTEVMMKSSKAQAYDRIRHLGMSYIKAGEITDDELRNLVELHEAYQAMGGDGFLDKVMAEVFKLRIRP